MLLATSGPRRFSVLEAQVAVVVAAVAVVAVATDAATTVNFIQSVERVEGAAQMQSLVPIPRRGEVDVLVR